MSVYHTSPRIIVHQDGPFMLLWALALGFRTQTRVRFSEQGVSLGHQVGRAQELWHSYYFYLSVSREISFSPSVIVSLSL